ncbi:hypothetical protein RIF29_09260 [Crotalaria pallida]|uniref:Uncharacterized protein n=1 Tax=Crotalaria pallida TaxID=3830 RepID=A0AAN9ILM1_CROPI
MLSSPHHSVNTTSPITSYGLHHQTRVIISNLMDFVPLTMATSYCWFWSHHHHRHRASLLSFLFLLCLQRTVYLCRRFVLVGLEVVVGVMANDERKIDEIEMVKYTGFAKVVVENKEAMVNNTKMMVVGPMDMGSSIFFGLVFLSIAFDLGGRGFFF